MSTCNLFEIVHSLWIHQFKKSVGCLFIATSDDYVRAFRQSASYRVYLNGGRCGKGLGRDELRLQRANQFGDPSQMAIAITIYTSESAHYQEMCPNSLWVSLNFEGTWTFLPSEIV